MIYTDKYEGHTEGPWNGKAKNPRLHSIMASGDGKMLGIYYGTEKVEREDPNEDPYESIRATKPSGEWTDWAKADARLIADAPLLVLEIKRLHQEINQLPIDLHESLDMILEAHHPEVRESVMSMFGDAWGNNVVGYDE